MHKLMNFLRRLSELDTPSDPQDSKKLGVVDVSLPCERNGEVWDAHAVVYENAVPVGLRMGDVGCVV